MTTEPPTLVAGMGTAAPMQEGAPHGELEINFVYEGALRYFMGGRFVEVPAGSFSVFWAAMPHQLVEVEPNTEFMGAALELEQPLLAEATGGRAGGRSAELRLGWRADTALGGRRQGRGRERLAYL
jgi:hypothetical protein